MKSVLDALLNMVFPPRCVNCGIGTKSREPICEACFRKIPLHRTLFCSHCRARLPENKKVCHKDAGFILGNASDYDCDAVKNLIHGLKFQYLRTAAGPLGRLLADYAEQLDFPFAGYTVVPLPLSKNRLRKRGFNQSELIAEHLAIRLDLPLEANTLARIKNAKPQSETKSAAERRKNVLGCFAVNNVNNVRGRNILLIDDVVTSGATLLEAASALKSAGAKRIIAMTVAKA